MTPGALQLVVLALAAFRLTRLLGWDDLPPLPRLRDRLTGWGLNTYLRPRLAHVLSCGFCLGFWISLAVYGAWLVAPRSSFYALVPLALSGAVGLIAKRWDGA